MQKNKDKYEYYFLLGKLVIPDDHNSESFSKEFFIRASLLLIKGMQVAHSILEFK